MMAVTHCGRCGTEVLSIRRMVSETWLWECAECGQAQCTSAMPETVMVNSTRGTFAVDVRKFHTLYDVLDHVVRRGGYSDDGTYGLSRDGHALPLYEKASDYHGDTLIFEDIGDAV